MKTICYRDIGDGNRTLRYFQPPQQKDDGNILPFFRQKRVERQVQALDELRHMGDIVVYLLQGKKLRRLFVRRT